MHVLIHNYPTKSAERPDNYFRVYRRHDVAHFFLFSNASEDQIAWARSEARRVYSEIGGIQKDALISLWKKCQGCSSFPLVGEPLIKDTDPEGGPSGSTKHLTEPS